MRVTVLTSSRADFGIQLPLLRALQGSPRFQPSVVAFGSHADPRYGNTIDEVLAAGFDMAAVLPPVLEQDDPAGIALAMARTTEQFARFWHDHPTDLVVALGDRYEMFAAVAASLPFGLPIAHLHGGETTLGAIDNAMRHAITHMATLHFTCAEPYRQRVVRMIGTEAGVYDTGALGLDNLRTMEFLSVPAIRDRFGVDMSKPTVLITLHPETRSAGEAGAQWAEVEAALRPLAQRYQLLVTLPNADTHGSAIRIRWQRLLATMSNAVGLDSLGSRGYLSCMRHCAFMLGNSSSGYVEASFFPKPVIDIGERQTGRIVTPNIRRVPFDASAILAAVSVIEQAPATYGSAPGIYGDGHAAERMLRIMEYLPGRWIP
ncbi:MAG: UDP-N-acetylglucosamine 2-epimerase [Flavobacteriales bacterium]